LLKRVLPYLAFRLSCVAADSANIEAIAVRGVGQ